MKYQIIVSLKSQLALIHTDETLIYFSEYKNFYIKIETLSCILIFFRV